MLLAMMRMGYRMLYEHMRNRISGSSHEQRRALILGAGDRAFAGGGHPASPGLGGD